MAKDQLHLKMVIATKEIFITDFSTGQGNLRGLMELYMKGSLLIIELLAKDYISGLMEAFTKARSKMDSDMATVFIRLMMQLMKVNGRKVRNKAKAK